MVGFTRSLVSKLRHGKEVRNLLREKPQTRCTFSKQSTQVTKAAFRIASWNLVAKHGLLKTSPFALSTRNMGSCLNYIGTSYRTCATAAAPEHSSSSTSMARFLAYAGVMLGSSIITYYFYPSSQEVCIAETQEEEEEFHIIANWSNTHEVKTKVYIQPESLEELERVVQNAHDHKQKIRAVGSGLSPNGIGLSSDGMVSLSLMDGILNVDKQARRVTVQAGARVEQVVESLKPYGLTLDNYASIKEQQIGGFIQVAGFKVSVIHGVESPPESNEIILAELQVSGHGTGALLPPVDEQVVSLKLVTPAKGTLDLTPESDPELFYFARCGLGALGVVAEVTLKCVPMHHLLEYTFLTNMKGVQKNHKEWLTQNKHLRYLWIPNTDAVVVVQCNPLPEGKEAPKMKLLEADEKLRHVRAFYKETAAKYRLHEAVTSTSEEARRQAPSTSGKEGLWSGTGAAGDQGGAKSPLLSDAELSELSFPELRDILIAVDPLNREHILLINKAEAEYWKRSEGYRTGWSDDILGFDCGGQQWVSEVSFPAGTVKNPDMADIKYMENLLKLIEKEGIPAPSPIEQRWTARSQSPLSPASSSSPDTLFSWVGIIMYLPTTEEEQREAITKSFFDYQKAARSLWDLFHAQQHWAKIEVPTDEDSLLWVQERLRKHFPVETFNRLRSELDPHHILSNYHLDQLFPQ